MVSILKCLYVGVKYFKYLFIRVEGRVCDAHLLCTRNILSDRFWIAVDCIDMVYYSIDTYLALTDLFDVHSILLKGKKKGQTLMKGFTLMFESYLKRHIIIRDIISRSCGGFVVSHLLAVSRLLSVPVAVGIGTDKLEPL